MAKRSQKKTAPREEAMAAGDKRSKSFAGILLLEHWIALLLGVLAFLVYWPSLSSDFVYDGTLEIQEGFLASLSNLPDVLSLKVLSMPLILGSRPGSLLYLMLIAAVSGTNPFGYHLCSNLLHAANVALLFILLLRFTNHKIDLSKGESRKILLATAAVALFFGLHPLAVEPVAAINYCSDLLVTFFTLIALLASTFFNPDNPRSAWLNGILGTLCAFAAVSCKESGVAASVLLIVYWFLFRRHESKGPWLWFLGAAVTVTSCFLAARFLLAPNTGPDVKVHLGESFLQIFLIQSKIWVFMMGKIFLPVGLSADYTLENFSALSIPVALVVLALVVSVQLWLASKSRLGAMGAATYWLGLATVSNFVPLYRIVGDRFYYLPMAGVAMQFLALFLLTTRRHVGFWALLASFSCVIVPMTWLTISREQIFANNVTLWSETVQVSPYSWTAHVSVGTTFALNGKVDEAIAQFQKALELGPGHVDIYSNLGLALFEKGQVDEAIVQYETALKIDPNYPEAQSGLGSTLFRQGKIDEAIAMYEKALLTEPYRADFHNNLGSAFVRKGQLDDAVAQYQKALELNPQDALAHYDLGTVFMKRGQLSDAIAQFQTSLTINPNSARTYINLGNALQQTGQIDEAIAEYQKALEIEPNNTDAQSNLNSAQNLEQQAQESK
jgi:Tfp pilus assembly protein PilF